MSTISPITITIAEARLLADLLDEHTRQWERSAGEGIEGGALDPEDIDVIERNRERASELRILAHAGTAAFRAACAKPTTS